MSFTVHQPFSHTKISGTTWWFLLILLTGSFLRMLMAFRGYNFDIASYRIVADIAAHDGNVYAETQRYNYGPIWFYILSFLDQFPFPIRDPLFSLRWKLSGFLTLVDMAIAVSLYRWYGLKIASLFFLNPISIIITGYHSQFDNLALFIGLLSAKIINVRNIQISPLAYIAGLALLGLSISIKHVLFLFPLWLAFKQNRWRDKLLCIGIPYLIFLSLFIPYWAEGKEGIINNVFLYRSFANAPFWTGSAPSVIIDKIPVFYLFIGSLMLLGLHMKPQKPLESLFIYTIALVIFSSAVANQYLAICIAAIAVHSNLMYVLYSLAGGLYLAASGDGLHFALLQHYLGDNGNTSIIGYKELILLLFLGLILQLSGKDKEKFIFSQIKKYTLQLGKEIYQQFKSPW